MYNSNARMGFSGSVEFESELNKRLEWIWNIFQDGVGIGIELKGFGL